VLIVSESTTEPLYDSDFLRQPDVRLLTAYPGVEALDIAQNERPCLIITEVDSSGRMALEFCRQLYADPSTQGIPLIVVAADGTFEDACELQADLVLHKPVDHKKLFDAVRRYIPMPHRRTKRVNINLRFTFEADGRLAQAFSRNLSPNGVFLKTDRLLPLGTRVDLRFHVPGVADEFHCTATVRCTAGHLHAGDPGGMGLEFEGLSDEDRSTLRATR
jgi:uncharacterized protein (TIGR02266 family)